MKHQQFRGVYVEVTKEWVKAARSSTSMENFCPLQLSVFLVGGRTFRILYRQYCHAMRLLSCAQCKQALNPEGFQ